MDEKPMTDLKRLESEARKEAYMTRQQVQVRGAMIGLGCWIATGVCAVTGTWLGSGAGPGFGVAAVWFLATGIAVIGATR